MLCFDFSNQNNEDLNFFFIRSSNLFSFNIKTDSLEISRKDIFKGILFFKIENGKFYFTEKIGDFLLLDYELDTFEIQHFLQIGLNTDPSHTFLKNVHMYPFGFTLIFKKGAVEFLPLKELSYTKNKVNYSEMLANNMASTLKSHKKVAIHVSGGIDSTSLASILCKKKLDSNVLFCASHLENKKGDERTYRTAFEEKWGKEIREFKPSIQNIRSFFVKFIETQKYPILTVAPPTFNLHQINTLCREGYDALIMGDGGDTMLDFGFEYLEELIKKDKKKDLVLVFKKLADANVIADVFEDWEVLSPIAKQVNSAYLFISKFKPVTFSTIKVFNLLRKLYGTGPTLKLVSRKLKQKNRHNIPLPAIDHKSISLRTLPKLSSGFNRVFSAYYYPTYQYFESLTDMLGIKFYSPFYQEEVLAYTESFPLEKRFKNGEGRGAFKDEMEGILPEKVRTRIQKTYVDTYIDDCISELIKEYSLENFNENFQAIMPKWYYEKWIEMRASNKINYTTKRKLNGLIYRSIIINIWLKNLSISNKSV
jgi:asparagine synthase (glutamine-hydrolysing)